MSTRVVPRLPHPTGELPPLPDVVPAAPDGAAPPGLPAPFPPPHLRRLRGGCYLLRYLPTLHAAAPFRLHYDGTLRVQHEGTNTIASGDLYRHSVLPFPLPVPPPAPGPPFPHVPLPAREPNPAAGIPIFARSAYTYYVRVTQILENVTLQNQFTLGFELHRYAAAGFTWTNEGAFTALMKWVTAPAGYPSSSDYLTGDVKNAAGTVVGTLTMGWVSSYLRKATLEIDRVAVSEAPLHSGTGVDWKTIFDQVGWDLTIDQSESNLAEPSGAAWSDAEMHAAMLAHRDNNNLDREWHYHLICVRELDSTTRGIMYDNGATDSNNVPREGAGISSHWVVPNEDPWGKVKGLRFGTATAPYYRTAVHEIGHAMGLYHNTVDDGFMNTTPDIAANAVPPVQFPDNIQWSHAPDDQKRLRHMPDIWVRPGGIPFGQPYTSAPISPNDLRDEMPGLELYARPLMTCVPIGAPVRLELELKNVSGQPLPAPPSLSLKKGFVSGKVIHPAGTVRTFSPLVICLDEPQAKMLAPGESLRHSVSLLRGGQGALFPSAGSYRIVVEVDWEQDGCALGATAEAGVAITPAQNDAHAEAAHRILSEPDTLLALALGGDHMHDGQQAIEAGLNDAVLGPHYAAVEAKRLATGFGKRKADLQAAGAVLDAKSVIDASTLCKLATMVKDERGAGRRKLGKLLQDKAAGSALDEAGRQLVRSL